MTDYCKAMAAEIERDVYSCLGCKHLIRTDCPRYESKVLEVTNTDFDDFFRQNHLYKPVDTTIDVSEL